MSKRTPSIIFNWRADQTREDQIRMDMKHKKPALSREVLGALEERRAKRQCSIPMELLNIEIQIERDLRIYLAWDALSMSEHYFPEGPERDWYTDMAIRVLNRASQP